MTHRILEPENDLMGQGKCFLDLFSLGETFPLSGKMYMT